MAQRIPTTQTGSLPRPDSLIALNRARRKGEVTDETAFQAELRSAVEGVVARQRAIGIDVVGDGEYGKSMSQKVDYGAWWSYSFQRLDGLELRSFDLLHDRARAKGERGKVTLASFAERRDWQRFADAYGDPTAGVAPGSAVSDTRVETFPTCTGPLRYSGQAAIAADIAHFKSALEASDLETGFLTSVAPGSCARIGAGIQKGLVGVVVTVADARASATVTTTPTRPFCMPAPMRCARSIARFSMPACCCSSTIRRLPRTGT